MVTSDVIVTFLHYLQPLFKVVIFNRFRILMLRFYLASAFQSTLSAILLCQVRPSVCPSVTDCWRFGVAETRWSRSTPIIAVHDFAVLDVSLSICRR